MTERETPRYIVDFVKAICPSAPDLYLASFNEEHCLRDATRLIKQLQAELSAATRRAEEAEKDLIPPAPRSMVIEKLVQRVEQAERESSERLKALLEAQERVRELEVNLRVVKEKWLPAHDEVCIKWEAATRRCEQLEKALRLVLPMAKGYANEHTNVGNNRVMVHEAEEALSSAASEDGGTSEKPHV